MAGSYNDPVWYCRYSRYDVINETDEKNDQYSPIQGRKYYNPTGLWVFDTLKSYFVQLKK